jgi:hypothetical protein
MRARHLGLVLSLLLVGSCTEDVAAPAPPDTAVSVSGSVKDLEGQPVPDAMVELLWWDCVSWDQCPHALLAAARSGADGRYEVTARIRCPGNDLVIWAAPPDHDDPTPPPLYTGVDVDCRAGVQTIDLTSLQVP